MSDGPIVLFGAFDRHNLGDFLLGQAAARQAAPRPCLFAGLRAADWRPCGGFAVQSIGAVLAGWKRRFGEAPFDLIHVGGEILDTDAWEAAVMLLDGAEAADVIRRLDRDAAGRMAWAAGFLGCASPSPYVFDRSAAPWVRHVEFRGVGGVGLAQRDPAFRRSVATALAGADLMTVRDGRTRAALAALGIEAAVQLDPVTTLGFWLATEVAPVPSGVRDYVAVQFAASFGDDATLAALAAALDRLALPVLLFRAGAAPWHDELDVYARFCCHLRMPVRRIDSLHVRDICAAIAGARLCLASSLHVLLVAGRFGVPAIGLERLDGEGAKLRAYAETWGGFAVVTPDAITRAVPGRV